MTGPRGRPPIGAPILIRLPAETRDRIEARKRDGEALAETIRRLLDIALSLPDQEKRDSDDGK